MRARLALLASGMRAGVDYEHREVVLKAKPPEMLAASPKGTVPVLVLPSGQVIDQSLDIMLWALRQNDPYNWLVHEKDALQMIALCDGDFKFHLDRYKYPNRYVGVNALEHRTKAAEFAGLMNAWLQHQAKNASIHYEFDSRLGIYYAGCMPFLRQFANTDETWFATQPWPALQSVLVSFEASVEFKTVMQQHAAWQATAA
jgi:glutathione S-transferase